MLVGGRQRGKLIRGCKKQNLHKKCCLIANIINHAFCVIDERNQLHNLNPFLEEELMLGI